MTDTLTDQLKSLHTAAIDARNGYTEALEDAEGKGMTPLFREMIALHSGNASELETELNKLGEKADDSGSFMSTVHRTIMSVRSIFNGLGPGVVPGLIDGEERNLKHYDEALELTTESPSVHQLLLVQRERIAAAIARMTAAAPT